MKDARKVEESKPDVRKFKSTDGEDYEPLKCKCKFIRNWPLPIGAFQDQRKQTVINKHNLVKNPNHQAFQGFLQVLTGF